MVHLSVFRGVRGSLRYMAAFDLSEIVHVPYRAADHKNFILDAWLQSMRRTRFASHGPKANFYPNQQAVIESILDKATCKVYEVSYDEGKVFAGFVVHDRDALHYLYVKFPYRRLGIAKKILDDIPGLALYSCIFDGRWKRSFIEDKRGLRFDFYSGLRYVLSARETKEQFEFGN